MADESNVMIGSDMNPESIKAEDARATETGGYLYPDDQALEMVVADLERCDAFMNINIWASNWILSDTLLQSPQNTNMLMGTKSNIPVFTLSNHLSAIVPKAMGALFYENPPFLLRPRPGTTQDLVRAKSALFTYQLDDMEFPEQIERGFTQMAHLGTGIWKWGYTEKTVTEKKYKPAATPETIKTSVGYQSTIHTEKSDEIVYEYEERQVCRPWLKNIDIREVRVDPGCRVGDIREAKYVIHTEYPTYRELDDLREQEDYDIPSETELKEFFGREKGAPIPHGDNLAMTMPEGMRGWLQHAVPRNQRTTADPLAAPLLLIERQDCHSIITVLVSGEDYILVRNSENPAGKIMYLSANWRDLPDAFYGQGLGILIGVDQIVDQGLQNLSVELIGYGLHPQLVRKKGFNAPTQNIIWRQGGIIDVDDDVRAAFGVLSMPEPPRGAWEFLNMIRAKAQETSGANQQTVMGAAGSGGQSTGMRSGTGAQAVTAAAAGRLDGPVERLIRQVYVPFLEIMDDLNNQFLPSSVLRQVLDDAGLAALKTDHVRFRNAKLEYEVLAGAHMGPKKEMAQFMPFLIQIVNNPTLMQSAADSGLKFNFDAFFKAMSDLAGFKYSQQFFKAMNPQEQQKHDANSPAAMQQAQAQAGAQAQATKFQQEQTLENQKEVGRAANRVLEKTMDHATASEEIEGTPGNVGFGDQTQG